MKKMLLTALGAALFLAIFPAPTQAGTTSQYFHPKSSLRYHVVEYTFAATTTNITGAIVGVVPPGRHVIRDVQLAQVAAGVGGTSWAAAVKSNGTGVLSTSGVIALADGANKSVNIAYSPMGALAKPTGATRPILDSTKVTLSGGEVLTVDVTLTGSYGTGVSGVVKVFLEPAF